MKVNSLSGKSRRIYNLKKIIKVLLIVMIYVFMFWGLSRGIEALIHKFDKREKCICEPTIAVVKETVIEEKIIEVTPETKKEDDTIVKDVKQETVTEKKQKTLTNTQKPATKNEYQAYAYDKVINLYLWSEEDYNALVKLWDRESEWNPHAHKKNSGAHGIPQSLPANKMASEGEDYYTNGYTQINWGLKYIKERYGSPLAAWMHSERKGWY